MKPTERLYFKKLQPADLIDYHSLTSDFAVMEHILGETYTLEESRQEVERLVNRFGLDPVAGVWVARKLKDDSFVGVGALIPMGKDLDLGYRITPKLWGKGYGYEIADALFQLAKNQKNIHKIIASTAADNLGSKAILEKLGLEFKRETTNQEGELGLEYEFSK